MLAILHAVGRNLGKVEPLASSVLLKLSRAAAAELVAVLDNLFETAPNADVARNQCRRVLSDPKALAAAKAVWFGLTWQPPSNTDRYLASNSAYDQKRKLLTFPASLNSMFLGNWHACPRQGEANAAIQLLTLLSNSNLADD